MEMDERTSRSCVIYLNGEYWGLYEMREKVDDPDFTNRYYDQGRGLTKARILSWHNPVPRLVNGVIWP